MIDNGDDWEFTVAPDSEAERSGVVVGSDNVLRDLGYETPDEELAKMKLAWTIADLIKAQGLTQTAAAKMTGIPQGSVSRVTRGMVSGFSVWRLMQMIADLGGEVSVSIRPASKGRIAINTLDQVA